MPVKIKPATGAGSVSLEAQNAISTDYTLTLPGATGTVALTASPVFTTNITVPTVIGGTTASSSLTLQSTSGVGTSDSIAFKVGNNGATTAGSFSTSGLLTLNSGLTVNSANIFVNGQNVTATDGSGYWAAGASTYTCGWYGSSGAMIFRTGGASPTMILDANGQLGLGASNPSNRLDIVYAGSAIARVYNTTSTGDVQFKAQDANKFFAYGLDAGSGYVFGSGAYPFIIYTNSTERARFNAGAPILCLAGGNTSATGTGIAFPATQSASSDVNTLDDYEEGDWTPSLTNLTVSSGSVTWTGKYTKIGRVVTVSFQSSGTYTMTITAGSTFINNLPFSAGGAPNGWGIFGNNNTTASSGGLQGVSSSTNLYFAATYSSTGNSFGGQYTYFV